MLVTYFLSQTYTAASNVPFVAAVATGVIFSPLAVSVASLLQAATVSLYTVPVGTFISSEESV